MDVPDFSYYRRSAVQSPSAKSGESAADRMSYRFCHLMITFRDHLFTLDNSVTSWLVVLG